MNWPNDLGGQRDGCATSLGASGLAEFSEIGRCDHHGGDTMPIKLYRRGKGWHYRGTVANRRLRGSCKTADQAIAARQVAEIEARERKCNFDGPQTVLTFPDDATMHPIAREPP